MNLRLVSLFTFVSLVGGVAGADVAVKVQPTTVRPGDAVLVTVTGATEAPTGDAGATKLQFFRSKTGYQAVFAVPLDGKEDSISVEVNKAKKGARVAIKPHTFPETSVVVKDELANPAAPARTQIDDDNQGMLAALTNTGEAQFTRAFKRPAGAVTSVFGEWRTFNDGHRSQHLGMDVFAKEGTAVKAVNAGTVTFVNDTYLAGKVVVVSHGRGIASAYFHLSASTVAVGDVVKQGAVVGKAGMTGRTTGPHLHLSIRVSGGFVDPTSFFKLKLTPTAAKAAARR